MRLHREGNASIIISLIVSAIIQFLVCFFIPCIIVWALFALALIVLNVLVIRFFRYPKRNTQKDDVGLVVSPCDGKVVTIEKITEPEYFKDERIQVSVFMSPLNVHVNYSPVNGSVSYYKYHKGKYLVAWHPKSSILNERTTIVVKTSKGSEVLFRQIAGKVARRIVCYVKEGNNYKTGEEIGFIKFGSRVDIILPIDSEIVAKIGQKVTGTSDIIARLSGF